MKWLQAVILTQVEPHLVPNETIEAKINVEILMVVVVEYSVRLPGLPPMRLEIDTGMIDDPVVVIVHCYRAVWHCNKVVNAGQMRGLKSATTSIYIY